MMTSFQAIQATFANNVRDPLRQPMPLDIEPRRMRIYQELIYNNIESFIANGFPILRHLTPDDRWHAMVRGFINCHACQSPYFCEIGQEFLAYLQDERQDEGDPPYLLELAHFEQVELALEISEASLDDRDSLDAKTRVLSDHSLSTLFPAILTLSPLAYLFVYRYPVHRFSSEVVSAQPSTYYLLIYRNQDFKVVCMEVSAVTARMVSIFQQQPSISVKAVLEMIIGELGGDSELSGSKLDNDSGLASESTFFSHAHNCLLDLIGRGVLYLA